MSKYTTEVRFICESITGETESNGYKSVNEIIEKAVPLIFDFDFPIFDENYRNVLCTKIIKHYYTREIGEETYGLWKLRLDKAMNEIMPYYNQLYLSELIKFNPLYDVDLTTDHTLKRDGTTISDTDGTNRVLYSDTPQGSLQNVDNETYLTNATKTITDTTNKSDLTSMDDYLEHIKGKRGGHTMSQMLLDFRKTFLNIDVMVIDELSNLFMNIW